MNMKQKEVLVFGVEDTVLRSRIERYIGEEYRIIGYSDLVHDADIIQGRFFVDKTSITDYNLHAIVLCSTEKDEISELKEYIGNIGYEGYVIDPKILYYRNCVYIPDLVWEIVNGKSIRVDDHVSGLILGMSYSFFGIDERNLSGNWINLSYRGIDMFYNIELYNLAMKGFETIKHVIFVMPYYYFDYDMSQLPFEYSSGQIFAVRKLGWHNAEKKSDSEVIQNYILCDKLFGDRFFAENRGNKFFYNEGRKEPFYNGSLSHLWTDRNTPIESENADLFASLLDDLLMRGIHISIVIPPLYSKCLSNDDLIVINKSKEFFYKTIEQFRIKGVYDYFGVYDDDIDLFWDFEHLNYSGKEEFTELLNKEVCAGF